MNRAICNRDPDSTAWQVYICVLCCLVRYVIVLATIYLLVCFLSRAMLYYIPCHKLGPHAKETISGGAIEFHSAIVFSCHVRMYKYVYIIILYIYQSLTTIIPQHLRAYKMVIFFKQNLRNRPNRHTSNNM